jgi:predicted sulfurtransferase
MKADIDKIDVKGKIVVANRGENDSTSAGKARSLRHMKQKLLFEKGAIALIERYREADTM